VSGKREWPKGADSGPAQPLYSPADRASSAEEARRPLQASNPPTKEKR